MRDLFSNVAGPLIPFTLPLVLVFVDGGLLYPYEYHSTCSLKLLPKSPRVTLLGNQTFF